MCFFPHFHCINQVGVYVPFFSWCVSFDFPILRDASIFVQPLAFGWNPPGSSLALPLKGYMDTRGSLAPSQPTARP